MIPKAPYSLPPLPGDDEALHFVWDLVGSEGSALAGSPEFQALARRPNVHVLTGVAASRSGVGSMCAQARMLATLADKVRERAANKQV